jgi:hypothetical protein
LPSLSFFVDQQDLRLLIHRLNADPEIAFIVPIGAHDETSISWKPVLQIHQRKDGPLELKGEQSEPQWWKAVRTVESLEDGEHSLWHLPAGPLPLIEMEAGPRPLIGLEGPGYPPIPDPWAGWIGRPGFGPGCHPWIRLSVFTRYQPYTQQERATCRRLTSFWLDEHEMFVVSGIQWTGSHFRPAPQQTLRWWNRMRDWVDRSAVKLHSGFWAFPSALQKLKSRMRYYSRNFDLDEAIQNAENQR